MDHDSSEVENDAYAQFCARIIRSLGRRVARGDMEDLRLIRYLRSLLDEAEGHAIRGGREQGYSFSEIATAVGVTRQTVHERYHRHLKAHPERAPFLDD